MSGYSAMTYKTRFQYLFDKASDIAHAARASSPHGRELPPLFFVTDPARIRHPEDIAERLPEGCGIIYRHFGEPHARERATLLRRISRDRGLTFLVGEDDSLAAEVEADGVHLREHSLDRADAVARPGWLVTAACHTAEALKRAERQKGLAAVFVSPVFASTSPSAHGVTPLGAKGARALAEAATLPVLALGGITCDTIEHLHDCGLAGVAAVEAFKLEDV
jgi:thiamine-phosphate pyrophosphorylase